MQIMRKQKGIFLLFQTGTINYAILRKICVLDLSKVWLE